MDVSGPRGDHDFLTILVKNLLLAALHLLAQIHHLSRVV